MIKAVSLTLAAALFALAPGAALAVGPGGSQPRAWISGAGSDVSSCGTIKTPCRTIQYAHDSIVIPGGAIYIQDPANYVGTAPVTLTHAISIVNDGVGAATIVATGDTDAIDIQAGATDAIFIKGLILEGAGTGANGINLTSGGSLTVANCTIRGFGNGEGVLIASTTGFVRFDILDTIVSGSLHAGIFATNSNSGTVKNVYASGNAAAGLLASTQGSSVTVTDSVFSHNGYGLFVSASPNLGLSNSVATGNVIDDMENVSGTLTTYQNNLYNTTSGTITKGSLH